MNIIKLKNVSKFYHNKNNVSSGFSKINLELEMGEFVVITGESGSGKSTLLNVISGLDSYEEGEMYINGEETSHYTESEYEIYRRKYIGNIFQNFNLVNSYTVYQNIELVLLLNGFKKREIKKKILEVIETVGLTKYKNTKASKLSGGQKQRVAIARALVKDTPIIVADEPTGNLDVASAKSIMKLLSEISKEKLVVIVTHNYEQVSSYATRKITMNDGKIIEDKKLCDHKNVEAKPIYYKNITFFNKLLLGLRNTFNIKTKFVLLLLVYFFLTVLVFSGYSSISKMKYDSSLNLFGYNPYFEDKSANRIIINKKDRSIITDEDFKKIKELDNIKSITEDDLFTDSSLFLENEKEGYWFNGNIKNYNSVKSVDVGRIPENDNEIIIECNTDNYQLRKSNVDNVLDLEFGLNSYNLLNENNKVKIVGVIYNENHDEYTYTFYTSSNFIDKIRMTNNINYSKIELSLNGNIYKNDSERLYYTVSPSNKVGKGKAYLPETLNIYCPKNNCLNSKINIKVITSYFDENMDATVNNIYSKNNITKLLDIDKNKFEENMYTIYINSDDFNKLYNKGIYQSSIYINDYKKDAETISSLNNLGFNTYYMQDLLVNHDAELMGILRIFMTCVFVVSIVVLFFISYFIIKIILKSRNIYYSTIRILGANKKVSKSLLNIELFNDINIAYFLFMILVILCKKQIINNAYILDMITYFKIKDYVTIYIILVFMSLLIAIRYSRKLFTSSALETYREEI